MIRSRAFGIRHETLKDAENRGITTDGRVNGTNTLWIGSSMSSTDHNLDYLSPAAAGLGYAAARPRAVAIGLVIALTGLGWLWLGLLVTQETGLWAALCRPQPGDVATVANVAVLLVMWCAMVLAMMLPSASPMILTYAEIADTAAQKSQSVVSPWVLVAGYILIWIGFAAAATASHVLFSRSGLIESEPALAGGLASGAIFIGAGLYQFSSLKQACLRLCRQPFQFFFVNWATTPRGVFHLGLRQGLYCLGCCWAMMALMFTLGAMNVLWMAALGAIMTIEKFSGMERFSRAIGAGLIAIGGVFMLSAVRSS
jgi:predicted metal-binding membrane protein